AGLAPEEQCDNAIDVVERTCAEAMAGSDEIVFQTLNAPLRGVRFILQERGSGAAVSTPCSTGDRVSPDTEN
ncbi:hypothetical protein HU47_27240, partial [Salmonella enterica subsp. enterica serovar Abaetetuba]|nr:hypothetical protein [Salmonella enterica subsp. enterica serovar Abaetetuba]